MRPFRWKNCYADVLAALHDRAVHSFLNDVVLPAIGSLDRRLKELNASGDPLAAFYRSDMEAVRSETKKAFALSIQSLWERQLRTYLRGCAAELRPGQGLEAKIEDADWGKLLPVFRNLRGIALQEFPSFERLDTLHIVGNACRHGDGKSARLLAERHPEWWPVYDPTLDGLFGGRLAGPPAKTVAAMEVPTECLVQFAQAIIEFWEDATYIYNESIEIKGDFLEAELARQRPERRWLPLAR